MLNLSDRINIDSNDINYKYGKDKETPWASVEEFLQTMDSNFSTVRKGTTIYVNINGTPTEMWNPTNARSFVEKAKNIDVVDNLTSSSATSALSAKQGKVLNDLIGALSNSKWGTVKGYTDISSILDVIYDVVYPPAPSEMIFYGWSRYTLSDPANDIVVKGSVQPSEKQIEFTIPDSERVTMVNIIYPTSLKIKSCKNVSSTEIVTELLKTERTITYQGNTYYYNELDYGVAIQSNSFLITFEDR